MCSFLSGSGVCQVLVCHRWSRFLYQSRSGPENESVGQVAASALKGFLRSYIFTFWCKIYAFIHKYMLASSLCAAPVRVTLPLDFGNLFIIFCMVDPEKAQLGHCCLVFSVWGISSAQQRRSDFQMTAPSATSSRRCWRSL